MQEFFTSLGDIEQANAKGVFRHWKEHYLKMSETCRQKIIEAGSDGARVNIGRNNIDATRIKD